MRKTAVKRKDQVKAEESRVVKVCFSCRCFNVGKGRKPKHGR